MHAGKMVSDQSVEVNASADETTSTPTHLTPAQYRWLARGLEQPGGKLPLFDRNGRKVNAAMIRRCIEKGLAEPWFANPLKPDWLVCKLTDRGRALLTHPGRSSGTTPHDAYDR